MEDYYGTIAVEWPQPRQLTIEEEAEVVERIVDLCILSAEYVSDENE